MDELYVPPKYPRTPHVPFSPEKHKDDRVITTMDNFIGKYVVITEKLDGSNCCMYKGKVYARSHTVEADHPSFNRIKEEARGVILKEYSHVMYLENMYAVHSIEYEHIKSIAYIINMLNPSKNEFFEFDMLSELFEREDEIPWYDERFYENVYPRVISAIPSLYRGIFWDEKSIKEWMDEEINKASFCGGPREGFVIRNAEAFPFDAFDINVAKYVRKGHVQNEDHWSRNWKPAKLYFGKESYSGN